MTDIKVINNKRTIPFHDIDLYEIFVDKDEVYMKIPDVYGCNAINLKSKNMAYRNGAQMVFNCDTEIIVKY